MYDKKYMKSHDKPLDTVEDAIMCSMAHIFCGGTRCQHCAMKMYTDNACSVKAQEARSFLLKHIGLDITQDGQRGQQQVWEQLFGKDKKLKLGQPEPEPQAPTGSCQKCDYSKMHTSGIRWCEKFCNFVHEDGYCYRFCPSVNMEKESAK